MASRAATSKVNEIVAVLVAEPNVSVAPMAQEPKAISVNSVFFLVCFIFKCYVASCAGVPVSTRDGMPRDLLQTALAVYSIANAVASENVGIIDFFSLWHCFGKTPFVVWSWF